MAVDRPTFSESWYRVADLTPRLRSTVEIYRQHFRGRIWHVLRDAGSNDFFRLNEAAYRFVALLDGRRTVRQVWRLCNEQLGDAAPTQGEAIQLLGRLYTSNLLMAEMPPDAASLLKRYRQRITRQVQGQLMNLMFLRIPLIDPDRFLERWRGVFGWLFSWVGFVLWVALLGTGIYFIAGRPDELWNAAEGILAPANLPLLYLAMVITKVFHEFGHAFAVKRFGRAEGGRGEVHTMGVMLLVFMPLPFVDASSAWAFRSKLRRVVVGCAGMIVELGVAAVAAIVWANTAPGGILHPVCYNIMFIASVSSLLFNANPLLRFDGYYILSDLLEIPNLHQRSRQYLYYLVKRYAWAVPRRQNPAHTTGERIWFVVFGIASTIYRVFIFAVIVLFVTDRLPRPLSIVALTFAAVAVVGWLVVPLVKFVRYLFSSPELLRARTRAITTTAAFVIALVTGIGLIPAPDHVRAEGVVEPVDMAVIHAEEAGYLVDYLPSGQMVSAGNEVLVGLENRDLQGRRKVLKYQLEQRKLQRKIAMSPEERNFALADLYLKHIRDMTEKIRRYDERCEKLSVRATVSGLWIAPGIDHKRGDFIEPGREIGVVADLDELHIRAVVTQADMRLIDAARGQVEIRLRGKPDVLLTGEVTEALPAGSKKLPSRALGYFAGGPIETDPKDRQGTQATERLFQVIIEPRDDKFQLLAGQRVVIRFAMDKKPLAVQWWLGLRQMLEKRLHL